MQPTDLADVKRVVLPAPDAPEVRMADRILVLYGSYRSDRLGIRLADFIVAGLRARGASAEPVDAKIVGLLRGALISLYS
jgi:hypothetical protein